MSHISKDTRCALHTNGTSSDFIVTLIGPIKGAVADKDPARRINDPSYRIGKYNYI